MSITWQETGNVTGCVRERGGYNWLKTVPKCLLMTGMTNKCSFLIQGIEKIIHYIFSHHSRTNSIIQDPNYCICPFKICVSMLRESQHTFQSLKQKKEKEKALTVFTVVVWTQGLQKEEGGVCSSPSKRKRQKNYWLSLPCCLQKEEGVCPSPSNRKRRKSIDHFYLVVWTLGLQKEEDVQAQAKERDKKALTVLTIVVWTLGLQKEGVCPSPSNRKRRKMHWLFLPCCLNVGLAERSVSKPE